MLRLLPLLLLTSCAGTLDSVKSDPCKYGAKARKVAETAISVAVGVIERVDTYCPITEAE